MVDFWIFVSVIGDLKPDDYCLYGRRTFPCPNLFLSNDVFMAFVIYLWPNLRPSSPEVSVMVWTPLFSVAGRSFSASPSLLFVFFCMPKLNCCFDSRWKWNLVEPPLTGAGLGTLRLPDSLLETMFDGTFWSISLLKSYRCRVVLAPLWMLRSPGVLVISFVTGPHLERFVHNSFWSAAIWSYSLPARTSASTAVCYLCDSFFIFWKYLVSKVTGLFILSMISRFREGFRGENCFPSC